MSCKITPLNAKPASKFSILSSLRTYCVSSLVVNQTHNYQRFLKYPYHKSTYPSGSQLTPLYLMELTATAFLIFYNQKVVWLLKNVVPIYSLPRTMLHIYKTNNNSICFISLKKKIFFCRQVKWFLMVPGILLIFGLRTRKF